MGGLAQSCMPAALSALASPRQKSQNESAIVSNWAPSGKCWQSAPELSDDEIKSVLAAPKAASRAAIDAALSHYAALISVASIRKSAHPIPIPIPVVIPIARIAAINPISIAPITVSRA